MASGQKEVKSPNISESFPDQEISPSHLIDNFLNISLKTLRTSLESHILFLTINFIRNLKAKMTVLEIRFTRKDLFVCTDDTQFYFYSIPTLAR